MRIRHVENIDQLIHADAQLVIDEYRSVVGADAHEFRDESERAHYAALVRAWGMFAYGERFGAALAEAAAPASPSLEPICRDCGGKNLVRDASARWDVETQEWSISGVYDSTYCDDCEAESDTLCTWVPVEGPARAALSGDGSDA